MLAGDAKWFLAHLDKTRRPPHKMSVFDKLGLEGLERVEVRREMRVAAPVWVGTGGSL